MQNFPPAFQSSLGSFSPSNSSKPPKLEFSLFPFIILLFLPLAIPRSQSQIRFDKIRLILGNLNRFCGGRYRQQGVTEKLYSSPGCICLILSNVETQLWGENSIFLRQVFCGLQLLTVRLSNFFSVKATTNDEMRFPVEIASDKFMRKYHVCWFPKARSISTQLVQCRHTKVGKLGVFLRSLTPVASRVFFCKGHVGKQDNREDAVPIWQYWHLALVKNYIPKDGVYDRMCEPYQRQGRQGSPINSYDHMPPSACHKFLKHSIYS